MRQLLLAVMALGSACSSPVKDVTQDPDLWLSRRTLPACLFLLQAPDRERNLDWYFARKMVLEEYHMLTAFDPDAQR